MPLETTKPPLGGGGRAGASNTQSPKRRSDHSMPYENVKRRQGPGYWCPACGERVMKPEGRHYKLGPFYAHTGCTAECAICSEPIEPPGIGQQHTVGIRMGSPVHTTCKEK